MTPEQIDWIMSQEQIDWLVSRQEVIDNLREALKFYAYPDTHGTPELIKADICRDDCAGYYRRGGEIARHALNRWK